MQQYDQRRLRLFAVVLFLGIMAANLGRYLIFDGLYLWDARLRWQECAYVLHGLNPFDVMHSRVPSIESIGWLDASLGGTVPWAYVLGNVINPGFLPYSAMCVYILALDFIAPLVTALCMGRFLLRHRYVQDKYMAVLASLLVFAPSMWANAVLFGNQSGIVCCCVILSMCVLEDSETLAGLLLAVAMCKPQVAFVFLFPLLCKKHWKAITVTSGTVLGSWLLAAILTESMQHLLHALHGQGRSRCPARPFRRALRSGRQHRAGNPEGTERSGRAPRLHDPRSLGFRHPQGRRNHAQERFPPCPGYLLSGHGVNEAIGFGEGNLSGERFPSPKPTPSSPKTFDFIESLMAIVSGLKIVAHQRKRRASAYGCSSFKNLFKELKENDGWA